MAPMRIRARSFGSSIALWIAACSGTPLHNGRDAGSDVIPTPDTPVHQDVVAPKLDAAPGLPDAGTLVPDARILDAAVMGPDMAPVLPDAARPPMDTARPLDTALPTPDATTSTDPLANHTFRIDTQHPAPTPDPTCTQNRPADYFQFTFGPDTASLKGLMVSGSAAQPFNATLGPEANKLTFHITDLLAGGIITFERDKDIAVAQAIVYGSGVPVVRCLRGELIPQP